jgi:hypothetical protein
LENSPENIKRLDNIDANCNVIDNI